MDLHPAKTCKRHKPGSIISLLENDIPYPYAQAARLFLAGAPRCLIDDRGALLANCEPKSPLRAFYAPVPHRREAWSYVRRT